MNASSLVKSDATGKTIRALLFLFFLIFTIPFTNALWTAIGHKAFPIEFVEAGLVLLFSALLLYGDGLPLSNLGLTINTRWVTNLGIGAIIGILLIAAMSFIAWATGACRFTWTPVDAIHKLSAGALMCIAVAINEELIFRGYGLQQAIAGLSAWYGQILYAALFACAHLGNPGMKGFTMVWAIMNIFLAGLLLGFLRRRTGSLAMPIGLHFGWNWMQGTILGCGVSGGASSGLLKPVFFNRPEWLSGGEFGLEAGMPCAVLCIIAIAIAGHWNPKHNSRQAHPNEPLP